MTRKDNVPQTLDRPAANRAHPTRRQETITQLLEQHADLTDPMRAGNGGDKTGLQLMPHATSCHIHDWNPPTCTCWRRSIIELERLLAHMRDDRTHPLIPTETGKASIRELHWHLNERYLKAQHTTRTLHYLKGRWLELRPNQAVVSVPGGWALTLADQRSKHHHRPLEASVRIATWNPAVRPAHLHAGIAWLDQHWSAQIEPNLPVDKAA